MIQALVLYVAPPGAASAFFSALRSAVELEFALAFRRFVALPILMHCRVAGSQVGQAREDD